MNEPWRLFDNVYPRRQPKASIEVAWGSIEWSEVPIHTKKTGKKERTFFASFFLASRRSLLARFRHSLEQHSKQPEIFRSVETHDPLISRSSLCRFPR
jgi:hypothetical protein